MKKIIKTQSPKEFEKWKFENLRNSYEEVVANLETEMQTTGSFNKDQLISKLKDNKQFDNLYGKPKYDLKRALIGEQGHICAYCGKRIGIENSILEHIAPRSEFKRHQFDYHNLVLSCRGSREEKGKTKHHCDMKKSEKEINVNPVHDYYEWEESFNYGIDGSVSTSPNKNDYKKLIDVLNLNSEVLKRKRKAALVGFLTTPRKLENGLIKREYIKYACEDLKKLSYALKEKSAGKYFPYCEAVASMLDLESIKEKDRLLKEQLMKIKEALEKEGVDPILIKKALKI